MKLNNLNPYKANNLSKLSFIDHGFFTRIGGVSTGDFSSLNTSYYTKDNKLNVKQNRALIVNYFKNSNYTLITLNQQSKDKIIIVTKNYLPDYNTEGDALITNVPGIILGVYTADCVPILLVDPKTKIISTIHVGHNGALLGIIKKTINVLIDMGVDPNNIIAALGPSIKQKSYEVKSDLYTAFIEHNKENKLFFYYNKSKNSYFFSLQQYIIRELVNSQILNIEELQLDTYEYPELFFSHRYSVLNNRNRGVQISTILIKE